MFQMRGSIHSHPVDSPVFEVEHLGEIEVKGKGEPVNAYRVMGRKAAPGRLRGIEGLEAPMIGRKTASRWVRRSSRSARPSEMSDFPQRGSVVDR